MKLHNIFSSAYWLWNSLDKKAATNLSQEALSYEIVKAGKGRNWGDPLEIETVQE